MSEKCVPHRVALPLEHEEPSYIYLSLFSFQKQCFCNWYRDNKIQLLAALRSAFLEELLWWVSNLRTDNILGSETRPWSNTVILIAICATFWWVTKLSALEYHHIEHVGLTAKVLSTVCMYSWCWKCNLLMWTCRFASRSDKSKWAMTFWECREGEMSLTRLHHFLKERKEIMILSWNKLFLQLSWSKYAEGVHRVGAPDCQCSDS